MLRKATPGSFKPGDPRAGRRPGVPNKTTAEMRDLAINLLTDPRYRANFRRRLIAGKLAPVLELALYYYAYGKPKDTLAIEGGLEELRVRIVDGPEAAR